MTSTKQQYAARRRPRWRDWLPAGILRAVLALQLLAGAALAQEDATVRLQVEVLDAKGQVPADLTAADLEVVEGGSALPLTSLSAPAAVGAPGRLVIYIDQALSSSFTVKRAAEALAPLAGPLTELGEVEIVVAAETPEQELRSRDRLVVSEKLSRMALTDSGDAGVLEIRGRVMRDLRLASSTPLAPADVAEIVVAGIEEELELIRARREQLLAWAAPPSGAEPGRRILLLILDGFDLDPVDYYVQQLDDGEVRSVVREAAKLETLDASVRETSRALSGLGWTVLPVAMQADDEEPPALEYKPIEIGGDRGTTSAPGITIRPGSLFGRRKAEEPEEPEIPEPVLLRPREPLNLIAEATGGEVVTSDQALRDAVSRVAGRFEIGYSSALPLEANLERIEVRAVRPGLTVRARRWQSRAVPAEVAAIRLRRLLSGIEDDGGFDVAAVLTLDEPKEEGAAPSTAQLEARLDLRELEAATPDEEWQAAAAAVFRVSLAVTGTGAEPRRLHQEVVRAEDLSDFEEWRYRTRLELPDDAGEVAVLVEELSGGYWGGRRATVVRGDWAAAGDELLPAPTVIEIVRPEREILRGRVKFQTEVYDTAVARVDFLLNDREAASVARPPFSTRLSLGQTPRRQTLTVVAYDAGASELGRDSMVLNGGEGGLGVQIVRPESQRGTGWVEVEADIAVPAEHRLDRVLFFWNNEPVATVYAAPFRQRVFISEEKPMGYVRVVALLEDGTLAEDVAFMNGPDHGERLEVNLVELYVVVTDPAGRPVRGLEQDEFRIREDGVPQDIATFSDASDLPLTLGMAIDSSASMFVKLPRVQSAAIDFLHSTFSEQDRAFVVDFDSEPRLARSTTSSLDRIVRSIDSLEANGRTALWESVVFSLVQLQGVRGRKALIVFSDGADEDDQFPFRSSLSVAKKMGVPIYLILMRKQPKNENGLSLLTRSFTSRVNRLVEATGGRVFYGKEYRDLGEVYEEIEQELRSQYLLTYYPKAPSRGESWRTVNIDVGRRGLKPRTLSGYWD
ncbi:MAG: VWA domain-containing protein [bacterium]|nr:VWA domain-containing protein [bacterium]